MVNKDKLEDLIELLRSKSPSEVGIHLEVASLLFDKPKESISDNERKEAKNLVMLIHYNIDYIQHE